SGFGVSAQASVRADATDLRVTRALQRASELPRPATMQERVRFALEDHTRSGALPGISGQGDDFGDHGVPGVSGHVSADDVDNSAHVEDEAAAEAAQEAAKEAAEQAEQAAELNRGPGNAAHPGRGDVTALGTPGVSNRGPGNAAHPGRGDATALGTPGISNRGPGNAQSPSSSEHGLLGLLGDLLGSSRDSSGSRGSSNSSRGGAMGTLGDHGLASND